ncbi:ABC transporter permease [Cupriavidus metallidurans]|uniref:ABC transporter permease n=1 Tax=Cupriavidus metallidurans TaxID=119219 RepID=UPI001BFC026E|nr:ABC transporter permease [Cupriavidus metallidurans]QWC92246.1 ABC transporter permease [Cupriavidus metallidurans]
MSFPSIAQPELGAEGRRQGGAVATVADTASLAERFQQDSERQERSRRRGRFALNLLGVTLFLLAWEAIPHVFEWINPALFPPPSKVLEAAIPLIRSGELFGHIGMSLLRAISGFVIALVLGISVGVLTARIPLLQYVSEPVLHGFRSVPSLAVVPLAVLWFGIGEAPKVALIAWGAFFPIWITTFIGVRDTNVVYLRSAASLGAGRLQQLFLVVLPAALPFILAGLRQALAVSLVVLVAAELSGSTQGIAYMMSLGHQLFQVEIMFIGLVLLGVFGFLADRLFLLVTRKLFPWYHTVS